MNWKYLLLRTFRKFGVLQYLNLVSSATINGNKFRIPVFHGIGLDHFCPSEEWMTGLIDKLITFKGGQFIDVGVNIGQTLLKLKSVNKEIKYVGFEPNPKCVYYVNELIKLNAFANVDIIPSGIYSFEGIAQLFFDKSNSFDSCATLVKEFRDIQHQQRMVVPVISGRSLGFLDQKMSVLKIDVEGAEMEVIEQFKDIIGLKRPFVVCEILPAYSRDNVFRIERKERIETILAELNYKIGQIGHSLVLMESIPINSDVNDSNYLFYPMEDEGILGLIDEG